MNSIWRLVKQHAKKCLLQPKYKKVPSYTVAVGFCFIPVVHALDLSGVKKIEIPNQKDLSHEHLIQQAASVSVNAATQLLTQTVVAIVDISNNYKKALLQLMSVLEESQGGIADVNYDISDAVIALRCKTNELKQQLLELDTLLDYVEKVVLSTAEASYLIGAEFVSSTLTERLYNLKVQLEEKRKEISILESECLLLQKNIIIDSK